MLNREYYRFYQIILGLKQEYLNNRFLKERLLNEIQVDQTYGKWLEMPEIEDKRRLILYIDEQNNGLKRTISSILERMPSVASFYINNDKDKLLFDWIENENPQKRKAFIPNITIKDEKRFSQIVRQFEKSTLFNMKNFTSDVNTMQRIYVDEDSIDLVPSPLSHDKYRVSYEPMSDVIRVTMREGYNPIELINSKVPKYEMPDYLIEMIDRRLGFMEKTLMPGELDDKIWLDNFVPPTYPKGECNEFDIQIRNKCLMLTPKE